jgi:hypothetical protein
MDENNGVNIRNYNDSLWLVPKGEFKINGAWEDTKGIYPY